MRLIADVWSQSRGRRAGQATVEFAITAVGIIIPVTFAIIFSAQMLWVWHSVNEMTRDGARYAATHCWQAGAGNVISYMRGNMPVNVEQNQFQGGQADLQVSYYSRDPETGNLTEFTCEGECSPDCVPDFVTVRVVNYEYRAFFSYLGLSPVQMPDFATSAAIESAGCDPETGSCTP